MARTKHVIRRTPFVPYPGGMRRRAIPWDGDSSMNTGNKISSAELHLEILLQPGIYRKLHKLEDEQGQPITKQSVFRQIAEEFESRGLGHRSEMDLATRLRKWQTGFQEARDWLASNNIPNKEDGSKHDPETIAKIPSINDKYYILEPAFAPFYPFPNESSDSQAQAHQERPNTIMEPEDQMQQQEREQVQEEQQQEPTTSPTLSSSSISDPSQKRPSTTPAENTTTSSMGPTEQCQSENTVNATREPENPTSITSMLESSSQMPDNLKKPVVSTIYSRLSESNFVKIQKLRLKEKIHDDRMEIER